MARPILQQQPDGNLPASNGPLELPAATALLGSRHYWRGADVEALLPYPQSMSRRDRFSSDDVHAARRLHGLVDYVGFAGALEQVEPEDMDDPMSLFPAAAWAYAEWGADDIAEVIIMASVADPGDQAAMEALDKAYQALVPDEDYIEALARRSPQANRYLLEGRILTGTVAGDVTRFEKLAWDWSTTRSRVMTSQLETALSALKQELKKSPEGRLGIESFVHHKNRAVSLLCASIVLEWNPGLALPIIEAHAAGKDSFAFSAMTALEDYRGGNIDFDW